MLKRILCILFTVLFFGPIWAQNLEKNETIETAPQEVFDNYYTIQEASEHPQKFLNPIEVSQQFISDFEFQDLKENLISLLKFDHHDEEIGNTDEHYNRMKHFGSWIRPREQDGCLNTRGLVLSRDSLEPVRSGPNPCTIVYGLWDDPYSGETYKNSGDIQIDHVVPLKNAYIRGADQWDNAKRCLFANYMGNAHHLRPVYKSENTKKGDKSPDYFMPSNGAFHCQYLKDWLSIKIIWQLGLTPPEVKAIKEMAKDCTSNDFLLSLRELRAQRNYIKENLDLCLNTHQ